MITNTTGSDWFRYLLIWALFPFLNFLLWNYIGSNQSFLSSPPAPSSQFSCPPIPRTNINLPPIESGPLKFNYSYCQRYQSFSRSVSSSLSQPILPLDYSLSVTHLDPQKFEQFKGNELAHLKSPAPVSIISRPNDQCSQYAEVPSSTKLSVKSCVGIAWSSTIQQSQYLQRFNSDTKKTGRVLDVTTPKTSGIFRNVAKKRGRMALSEKLYPLFNHLDPIEKFWSKLLAARGIFPGHDIVLMVVNDGEIDLFLNFACSCRHHGISLHNVMVICASAEIVALVRATGALGYFDPFFGRANKAASGGYLDKTFVEMMWYKAFSLWIGLKLGYNVLFQDVDLVWFKNPFHYFENHRNISKDSSSSSSSYEYTAYFSDDGQRSIRYTPFYANSGFYYLISTPKNIYFAYSIVIAFDSLQATGSHQNVFTSRLMETMDILESHQLFLNLEDFPSGVKYHHDQTYMNKILKKSHIPYIFHMCWTANKKQKLENFAKVHMWYLKDTCTIHELIPPYGTIYRSTINRIGSGSGKDYLENLTPHDTYKLFNTLSSTCCRKDNIL